VSATHGIWAVQRKHTPLLNAAFAACDVIVLLFSVARSSHLQGCAVMTADIEVHHIYNASYMLGGY
jgi:YT521-B-like domain